MNHCSRRTVHFWFGVDVFIAIHLESIVREIYNKFIVNKTIYRHLDTIIFFTVISLKLSPPSLLIYYVTKFNLLRENWCKRKTRA